MNSADLWVILQKKTPHPRIYASQGYFISDLTAIVAVAAS